MPRCVREGSFMSYPDLAELTEWVVEARYPGDWPVLEATEVEETRAESQARATEVHKPVRLRRG